jgi:serine/threonine protein kinase/regulation of enolase protein 1 (concanavalin A-like superfamily)
MRNEIRGFDLGAQLGASGLGILVAARDRESGEECAVKLLHPPCGMHPEDLRNFLTVGRATMALDHPHIARIVAVGVEDGIPFVAREWLAGRSLAARLLSDGRMPEAEVLALAVQAASALAAANAQGLLHRDLRTANLILTDSHDVKITDFGQAILYDCASETARIVWGAPCYVSPERLRFLQEDARSDIYALGAILCHALTGQPPYDGEVQGDVLFERLEHEVTRVEALLPTIRPTTAAALNRMLAANAEDRPQTWSETVAMLTRARAAVPVPLAAPRPPSRSLSHAASRIAPDGTEELTAAPKPPRSSATAGSWMTVAMLLILCSVLAYAVWQWKRWPAERAATAAAAVKMKALALAQPTPSVPPPETSEPAGEAPSPPPAAPADSPPAEPSAPAPPPEPTPAQPAPMPVAAAPSPAAPATPAPAPPTPPAPPAPTVAAKPATPLPGAFDFTQWATAKLSLPGTPATTGNATPMSDKAALRITGDTDGITGRNDTLVFHYRNLDGDWTLVGRVEAIAGGVGGIMVREKVEPSSWCLAATIAEDGSVTLRTRLRSDSPAILAAPIRAPKRSWLRLVRRGSSLTIAYSTDGKNWRTLNSLNPPGIGSKVPAGFFASGAVKTGTGTATFDQLALKFGN